MMQARFHVFSGTGNTLHLARSLATSLTIGGFTTEILEVTIRGRRSKEASQHPTVRQERGDLDVFLFPVYALSMPRIMARYIGRIGVQPALAGGSGPRAVVLSTNGRISTRFRDGHEGQALAQAERRLSRNGWRVVHRDSFDYPQNITSVINPQDEDRRAELLAMVAPRIDATAKALITGRFARRRCSPASLIVGWPFGWLFRIFGRRAWAMLFAADESCDGCGLCASRCPAAAIRMIGGRPAWSYACEGCERCINACPKKAIQASFVRAGFIVALSLSAGICPLRPYLAGLLPDLPRAALVTLWMALAVVLFFVILRLVDLMLIALSFVPELRGLLAFGWTRWFRRYSPPEMK